MTIAEWLLAAALALSIWFPAAASRTASNLTFLLSDYQAFLDRYLEKEKKIEGFVMNVVDYDAIHAANADPDSLYRRVLSEFASFDPASLSTREDQIAFWINAYNLGAIKLMIDHYPVGSIRSRKIQWLRNPWGLAVLTVGHRPYSLGEIEHTILLGRLREPLVHFAIVCASLSCPDLSPEAYRASTLMAQLDRQARSFIRNEQKGLRIDRRRKTVSFSQIFQFDKNTFPNGAEDAIPLIGQYLDARDREFLLSGQYTIRYLKYDWSANAKRNAR